MLPQRCAATVSDSLTRKNVKETNPHSETRPKTQIPWIESSLELSAKRQQLLQTEASNGTPQNASRFPVTNSTGDRFPEERNALRGPQRDPRDGTTRSRSRIWGMRKGQDEFRRAPCGHPDRVRPFPNVLWKCCLYFSGLSRQFGESPPEI
jgi:hypothetical protein